MKWVVLLFMGTFIFSLTASAAMYEWTDNKGVVNFTDNPDKIPAKYLKKVKKRSSIIVDVTGSSPVEKTQEKAPPASAQEPVTQNIEKLYGGHDQSWWRSRFSGIRNELKAVQDGLPGKKENLIGLRRKMTIYNYAHDRKAYYDKMAEIKNDEAREKELNEQLNSLDAEASKAGVPSEWRQ
jgi:hypothetical protein